MWEYIKNTSVKEINKSPIERVQMRNPSLNTVFIAFSSYSNILKSLANSTSLRTSARKIKTLQTLERE